MENGDRDYPAPLATGKWHQRTTMDEVAGWDNTYDRIGRKHGTVFYVETDVVFALAKSDDWL